MKVSVGIPCFNAAPYILDAVRSVFAQTFTDWELILIDDGSTDESPQLLASLKHPKVKFISDGQNRGLIARLNQLVALAQGEFFARMDADDLMFPERLARQVAFLEAHPEIDLVSSGICSIDSRTIPRGIRGVLPAPITPKSILTWGAIIHPTVTGRIDWFRRFPYDRHYFRAEDREIWIRSLLAGAHFARIDEPLLFYREADMHSPDKLLAAHITNRKILKRYGQKALGLFPTILLWLRSCLQSLGIHLLFRLGAQQWLFTRRIERPLTTAEFHRMENIIRRIQQVPLPTGVNQSSI